MRTDEVAWAAGLFEGEGWISLSQNEGRRIPNATMGLSTTDEDVVRRFHKVVIVGNVTGPHAPTRKKGPHTYKPYWHWHLARHDAIGVLLATFWPWLGQRRRERIEEIKTATHVFSHKGPKKHPWELP